MKNLDRDCLEIISKFGVFIVWEISQHLYLYLIVLSILKYKVQHRLSISFNHCMFMVYCFLLKRLWVFHHQRLMVFNQIGCLSHNSLFKTGIGHLLGVGNTKSERFWSFWSFVVLAVYSSIWTYGTLCSIVMVIVTLSHIASYKSQISINSCFLL